MLLYSQNAHVSGELVGVDEAILAACGRGFEVIKLSGARRLSCMALEVVDDEAIVLSIWR